MIPDRLLLTELPLVGIGLAGLPLTGMGLAGAVAVVASLVATRRPREPGRRPPGDPVTGYGRFARPPRAPYGGGSERSGGGRPGAGRRGARWASRRDLGELVVRSAVDGRLVLGTLAGPKGSPGRTVLAAERAQSVAVIGPTQGGKTTSLAVPAILGWDGPVLAASVKTDLVRDTFAWRRRVGHVWCFDPGHATGLPASRWTPLPAAATWGGARRVAADLTEVTRGAGTTADGEFWYATAAKLLAPLLFAAAHAGLTMHDVVRWVDTQEVAEVVAILEAAGVPEALQAARATWQRDDRQRSSVYTTAETVLEPFAEPETPSAYGPAGRWPGRRAAPGGGPGDTPPFGVPAVGPTAVPHPGVPPAPPGPGGRSGPPDDIDVDRLVCGSNTLYVCAPAHDQRRLRSLFGAVVKQVLEAAFARSAALGGPCVPPLLVVLDEAANIAPLAELDGLAATCAGHGVQLVTVWQDLAQVAARYGERAATVINNHRAKVFLSGTADPRTLDHASHLVGDEELQVSSVTRDAAGGRTVTASPVQRRLLPPDVLRRMPVGTGVLVYGSLPPVPLSLRPWFADPELAERGRGRPSP